MTYRTAASREQITAALTSMGFDHLETSCFCTTHARGYELLSVDEPEGEVYEDVEIATNFRLSTSEMAALGAWHIGAKK